MHAVKGTKLDSEADKAVHWTVNPAVSALHRENYSTFHVSPRVELTI
jgi:hypothetical protein